jgi:hypothetical protein
MMCVSTIHSYAAMLQQQQYSMHSTFW